jgi:glycosyltransferase involved in cell wall biosynthesis
MPAERSIRRVLMTAVGVGGVWPFALDLARGLAQHDVSVDLAVMGPALSETQRAEAARAGVTPLEGPYRLEWMDAPWSDVDRAGRWLLDVERALRPDVVHLNGFCHGALPWHAPVVMVAHSCVRSWWRAVHGADAPAEWDEYSRRVRAGIQSAALVAAPTTAMLAEVEHDYGPLSSGRVIPNGRDFTPANLPREPLVFAAGRVWDEAKNIDALCAAACEIAWPVYVAGDHRHPTGSCVASGYVNYLGPLNSAEVRRWYARASIYALPARYEPFGLSVLEAARSGCALVLGDIRSLRENWTGAALFAPPDNRRAIASAIQSLIDDEPLRIELGRRAEARSRQFTVDAMTTGYLAAYEQVTAPARPGRVAAAVPR